MTEYPWRPLGELLVKRGLLDEYQLEPLLLEQRLSGRLFGEMLVAKRIVSPLDMGVVLAEQHGLCLKADQRPKRPPTKPEANANGSGKWRSLGRILVENDVLTESGLQRVLLTQQRKGGLLGQILLERRYVTPQELAEALAEQHGVAVSPEALSAVEDQPAALVGAVYEVRAPEQDRALHTSPSFLDASDFAFELLYDEDPDALEIIEVKGDERRIAWSYERPVAAS